MTSPTNRVYGDVFDPHDFGAKGDAQFVFGVNLTAFSDVVVASSPVFRPSDVGKSCWSTRRGLGEALPIPLCEIVEFISPTQVRVSSVSSVSTTNAEFHWGTDDTEALIRCFQACRDCLPVTPTSDVEIAGRAATMQVRAGVYHFRKVVLDNFYNSPRLAVELFGAGAGRTVFVPRPDFDFSTTTVNQGMFSRSQNAYEGSAGGFSLYGYCFDWIAPNGVYAATLGGPAGRRQPHYFDISFTHFKALIGSVNFVGLGGGTIERLVVYNGGYLGCVLVGCCVTLRDSLFSNGVHGLSILDTNGNTNHGIRTVVSGCVFDECAVAGALVQNSTDVSFHSSRFMATGNASGLHLRGGSVKANQCEFFAFNNHPNGIPIHVEANPQGSVLRLGGCRVSGTVNNYGEIYDGGGNELQISTLLGTPLVHEFSP